MRGPVVPVVAVYLPDRWWAVDDVLRMSNASRSGFQSVQSVMERVVVFLLSQVVDRPLQEEVHFYPHPPTETCKLLWREGEAVGFYSVKHKGSLCDGWSSRCYQLTVLDTLLVRRRCRRSGLGLHILDHFCNTFYSEDVLGVSAPLSASMVSVCRRFLHRHTEHRERLYEVEAPGGWAQRRNIWINIQLGRYAHGINKDISLISAETEQKEEDDSSEQVLTGADDAHLLNSSVINSSEQFEVCGRSPDGGSLSSRFCGTGCGAPAHADDLDRGRPTATPAKSHNTKRRGVKRVHPAEDTVH
uniref:Family with sequence similarity 169 member B n=1 Tax=Sphaeramia orbicularis TaxID=375764 RepID=A0A672ZAI0_9TELE